MSALSINALLATLDQAIGLQRQALARDDADALEAASKQLGEATATLAQARTSLDAAQSEHARRLQLALQGNRELLNRSSAAKQRALEALVGPSATYSAGPATARVSSGLRLRTA